MIKKTQGLLIAAGLFLTTSLSAQSDIDAIRYSVINPSSTARSLSMGGAFGALGADFSVLSGNPAGIGLYRKSEFSFTPAFGNSTADGSYFGKTSNENKFNFNFGNLGIIYAYPKEDSKSPWKGWAFGIGYNRLNNLHSRTMFEGVNPNNSILDSYIETANGTNYNDLDNFYEGLAFNTYLIDTLPNTSSQYFSAIPNGGALQRGVKESRGSLGEMVISFGGNYDNRIFWGFTLGIPYIRYTEDYLYEEIDEKDQISQTTPGIDSLYASIFNFKSLAYSSTLKTTGTGINAKFGLIFRPNDFLRFGVAVHSPTYYSMQDEWLYQMSAKFEGSQPITEQSPVGMYGYNLTTPFRAILSGAVLLEQQAIFSIDYEFADYSSTRLTAGDYSFSDENRIIRESYTQSHIIRAGAEWKYGVFAFRAGAGYRTGLMNSTLSDSKSDQHMISYSAGFGIREEHYFVDLGYSLSTSNGFYRPYELLSAIDTEPGAYFKTKDHKLLVTVGFRF
ncbi:MAG: hypothetical protein LC117_05045 [Bacteroidia bacterium]|nr:hypothetical protein [Bacteroidia bacterium]